MFKNDQWRASEIESCIQIYFSKKYKSISQILSFLIAAKLTTSKAISEILEVFHQLQYDVHCILKTIKTTNHYLSV